MAEKEINPKKAPASKAKATATKTRAKKADAAVGDIFEQAAASLPTLRDNKGSSVELTIANISSMGTEAGAAVDRLADQILEKVNIQNDNTEFGKSVTTILALTRAVDIDSLAEDNGIFAKIKGLFVNVKQKVGDQYKNSREQIEEIMATIQTGIDRMGGEAEWLLKSYNENKAYLMNLRATLENIIEVRAVQDEVLTALRADETTDTFDIQEQKMICEALSKQEDKIRRLISMCELQAPQIASMRKVNMNTIDKFESLKGVVLPAWKTQLAQQLLSDRQRKDTELGTVIDDETNRLLETNSKMISNNMIEAAKAQQRGVVDVKTLQIAHKNMLQGIQTVIAIEEDGERQRKAAAQELDRLSNEVKDALRVVAEKKGK